MKTLISILRNKFQKAIETAYPQLKEQDIPLEVVQSTQDKFGHYQCNSAMKLTKQACLKPREIAENLIAHLDRVDENGNPMIRDLTVAGPGFINITFDPTYLSKYVNDMLTSPIWALIFPIIPSVSS